MYQRVTAEREARIAQEQREKAAQEAAGAERQRLEAEAERVRTEQAEAERKRAERAEAQRKELERAEAERKRIEQAEAERKRAERAEAQRKELEAERKRLEEERAAERKRIVDAEAERSRIQQAEAERRRLESARAASGKADAIGVKFSGSLSRSLYAYARSSGLRQAELTTANTTRVCMGWSDGFPIAERGTFQTICMGLAEFANANGWQLQQKPAAQDWFKYCHHSVGTLSGTVRRAFLEQCLKYP